ncbi:MAG: Eco47II family restriction endonuclease [Coleofasciculaceae cyanobacterium RL_1_1]|nr:Eco47II family restriction endonuclease [Coleofasciculaceae cyanobacterium RL_1_1]
MPHNKLSFINDEGLYSCVKSVVEAYRFSLDLSEFNKNIIDPIKLTFDMKVSQRSVEEIIEREIARQLDKTISNRIGYFHQNIFAYISPDWCVPEKGYDIVNKSEKIYVEMKNKHNTMNSSSSQKTFMRMQNTLLHQSDATCLLVEVIAKESQDKVWLVSLDGERTSHPSIRRVSIDRFYSMVTKEKNAFRCLCEVLPHVIEDVIQEQQSTLHTSTVLEELQKTSHSLLKSLYLLAFKNYEGFDNLKID